MALRAPSRSAIAAAGLTKQMEVHTLRHYNILSLIGRFALSNAIPCRFCDSFRGRHRTTACWRSGHLQPYNQINTNKISIYTINIFYRTIPPEQKA
jgi:hypothetical protein